MNSDQRSHFFANRQAARPLHVIIVGAGMAGLTAGLGLQLTGHRVTILEQVPRFQETGAGIQIAPNAARVLDRFGVLADVLKDADMLERISQRRYADDQELGSAPVMPSAGRRYGAPVFVIHRGDLQRILVLAAKRAGCQIKTGQKVMRVDTTGAPRVQTADDTWHHGDLVLGADGIRSAVRGHVAAAQGHSERLTPTGEAAYRMLIPRDKLATHEKLLKLLNQNVAVRWIGPGGHAMGYPIRHHSAYNLVILHPAGPVPPASDGRQGVWTVQRDKAEVVDFCRGWSPLMQELLSCVPDGELTEWMLYTHAPLKHWAKDRAALIGDACHPMLPYTAQGAANAIEDAGALVTALTCTGSVGLALAVYQEARQARCDKMQAGTAAVGTSLHLPDGEEQRRRDDAIRRATAGFEQGLQRNPDLWADRPWQDFMWGVDVMKDMAGGWDDLMARARARHVGPSYCCCCCFVEQREDESACQPRGPLCRQRRRATKAVVAKRALS
ncbi:FAD binding domain-containing protein [Hirsutella rhossiliensis]|uniref:FAD binding domain-containing protein n=1 Tax=Hirsutella rhossiliensis TaxID=111463 RepID=A0A9P8MQ95_9HYPO|nr:FAD binding domain-containing protein [Hirsutella rhossiliensis]KAH0959107.1 FAD binding domain-containing protein [Hirsutella rhossiliensis]